MMPEVMQFSCCDHPFRVSITRCADFECECTELYFSLREVTDDGRPVPEGRTLEVRVDGDTWQEIDPPPRDAQSEQMVRELLDGYPATGKEHLQQDVREKRRAVRRLRNFRFDPDMIAEGTLVAFGEIISDRRRGAKAWSFAYDWEHDGDYYLLEDLYCCNPTCPCRDVHVSFFRCSRSTKTQRKPVTEEQFVAILSLDGKWRIGNCYKCSEAKAKELLRAWRQDEPDHLEDFRWRHDKVKEIARRSFGRPMLLPDESPLSFEAALEPPLEPPIKPPLELADEEPDEDADGPVLTREVRVGRNEPCPCGSGKKYKKCCGKVGPPRE